MNFKTFVAVTMLGLFVASAQAGLVLHWKLDESTGPKYHEEVYNTSDVAVEVGSVTEGAAGIAPDGGTSITFADTDPGSYIDAGTVLDNAGAPGAYVAGSQATAYRMNQVYSMTAWFNLSADPAGGDYIILSSDWNSKRGWMLGVRNSKVVFDFGNTRAFGPAVEQDKDYFVAVLADPDGDTNFDWDVDANHRIALYDVVAGTWATTDGTQSKPKPWLQGLEIGSFNNGDREWQGNIDDVQIFNHTLTQSELDALVVPEPATLALLGIGGLAILRRRK